MSISGSKPLAAPSAPAAMSPREASLAMVGMILSMFVAVLSNLIVLTALPRIVADLHGGQAAYTWIVTSSMLTITVCTPIWGRISDVIDKKRLIQLCTLGYVLSSIGAGLAASVPVIIACRVAIGVCAAGMIILIQTIAVEIMPPRTRARWVGYRAAVMSVATVGAPTLGGFVAEHLGWRWCFFIAAPVGMLAVAIIQKTLHLAPPHAGRPRSIDWIGSVLLSAGLVALMLWVSVVGPQSGWSSGAALAALAAGLLILTVAFAHERRTALPILPLELFRHREVVLCTLAGCGVGIAFFGSAVFLAIYLQFGRGFTPAISGLMALPEAAGTVLGSMVVSQFISRTGRYKPALILGAGLVTVGFSALAFVGTATPLAYVGVCVAVIGAGLGIVSENLVLIVQTTVARTGAGAAGALVSFFRMLGGVSCVAVLGSILSAVVIMRMRSHGVLDYDGSAVPRLAEMTPPLRVLVEAAYAHGAAIVYLTCVPAALLILIPVCLLPTRTLEDR